MQSIGRLANTAVQWWRWFAEDYEAVRLQVQTRFGEQPPGALWAGRTFESRTQPIAHTAWPGRKRLPPNSPALVTLRQRAVWSLFDWLGADRTPNVYWRLLGDSVEPGAAMRRYVETIDVRGDALRAEDPAELREFRDITTLLAQSDVDGHALTSDMRFRLDALANRAAIARLVDLRGTLIALNNAVEMYDLSAPIVAFRQHQAVATEARLVRARVARTEVEEAQALEDRSNDWAEIVFAWRAIGERITSVEVTCSSELKDEMDAVKQQHLLGIDIASESEASERVLACGSALDRLIEGGKTDLDEEIYADAAPVRSGIEVLRHRNAVDHLQAGSDALLSNEQIQEAFRRTVLDHYPRSGSVDYRRNAFNYRAAIRHRNSLLAVARR